MLSSFDGAIGGGRSETTTRNAHHYQQHFNTQQPMFSSWGLPDYLAHLQSILPNEVPPPLVIRGVVSFFREDVTAPATTSGQDGIGLGIRSISRDEAAEDDTGLRADQRVPVTAVPRPPQRLARLANRVHESVSAYY